MVELVLERFPQCALSSKWTSMGFRGRGHIRRNAHGAEAIVAETSLRLGGKKFGELKRGAKHGIIILIVGVNDDTINKTHTFCFPRRDDASAVCVSSAL